MNPHDLLLKSFHAAVAAADPLRIVPPHLPKPPKGKTLVVGAGKAAAAMAQAVERHWPQHAPLEGWVITRYGHGLETEKNTAKNKRRIEVIEAGHPVPDEAGEHAAQKIFAEVQKLGADDLLLCLVSGGGSSLLSLPVDGVSMRDLKSVTKDLLHCGATIQEINTVRKHLSLIQGGRLAAVCRAPILALVVSDVTGDDPTHIASGPCAPDPTTFADALHIVARYQINAPSAVMQTLLAGKTGQRAETPKPGDAIFKNVENRVIATAHNSLVAAGEFFRARGIPAVILGDSVTGEAREVAKVYAALAQEIRQYAHPWQAPVALISGGETTVTIKGDTRGKGGRNAEFLLALTLELNGASNIHSLACDTDGIDGSENNAGAILAPDTLQHAAKLGLNPAAMLANHDAYTFFEQLGNLVTTGPTRTNVNDYRVILMM